VVDRAGGGRVKRDVTHAAAGGVGHVAVQLAKAKGAEVFATVSNDAKAEIADRLGATAINYRELSVADYVERHTDGAGFDIVYDTIGGDNIPLSWQAARANGTVVSCQSNSSQDLSPIHMKGLVHAGVLMLIPMLSGQGRAHHGDILRQIGALTEAGQMAPILDETVFPLGDIAAAHKRWESGASIGKVAIEVKG
jgi:NADPH2:quinone reductase